MTQTPVSSEIIDRKLQELGIESIAQASIRQIVKLVNLIESETGVSFFRMEMGIPGIAASQIGVDAEIEALNNGVASKYPMIDGLPELKYEISQFVKLFLDIDVSPSGCLPTVGSMQGAYASFMTLGRRDAAKKKVLFLDPGFPVQKAQLKVLGLPFEAFDVYNYRGAKLYDKLDEFLSKGEISSLIYSNPNNPSWICFSDQELKIIAELANKYDVIVIEDLAYFGMDFRKDYSIPGKAPFQPSVAKYTDNYILLISSSKTFSYAGQRIASLVISDHLYNRQFPELLSHFNSPTFGDAIIYGALYTLSSGTSHSAQYALKAILSSVNKGEYNFLNEVRVYGRKAEKMKTIFQKNGFSIVYDKDEDSELADGFYFTVAYPGFSGSELLKELLNYGISAISLAITGSEKTEGIRACTSVIDENQLPELEKRLELFYINCS